MAMMAAVSSAALRTPATTTTTTTTTITNKSVLGFLQMSNLIAGISSVPRIHRKISSTHLSFRCENAARLQMRRRMPTLFANPSEGDIVKEKDDGGETGDTQGPPFLTILAGFVVFLFVCWIVVSFLTWLISLIVNISPFK